MCRNGDEELIRRLSVETFFRSIDFSGDDPLTLGVKSIREAFVDGKLDTDARRLVTLSDGFNGDK